MRHKHLVSQWKLSDMTFVSWLREQPDFVLSPAPGATSFLHLIGWLSCGLRSSLLCACSNDVTCCAFLQRCPLFTFKPKTPSAELGCAKKPTEPKPFSSFLMRPGATCTHSLHWKQLVRQNYKVQWREFGCSLAIRTSTCKWCYVRFSARFDERRLFSWLWESAHRTLSFFVLFCAGACVFSVKVPCSDDKWWT